MLRKKKVSVCIHSQEAELKGPEHLPQQLVESLAPLLAKRPEVAQFFLPESAKPVPRPLPSSVLGNQRQQAKRVLSAAHRHAHVSQCD